MLEQITEVLKFKCTQYFIDYSNCEEEEHTLKSNIRALCIEFFTESKIAAAFPISNL